MYPIFQRSSNSIRGSIGNRQIETPRVTRPSTLTYKLSKQSWHPPSFNAWSRKSNPVYLTPYLADVVIMFIRLIASIRDPFFIFFHPFEQRLPRGRRRVGFYRSKDIVEQSMILLFLVSVLHRSWWKKKFVPLWNKYSSISQYLVLFTNKIPSKLSRNSLIYIEFSSYKDFYSRMYGKYILDQVSG